MSTEKVEMSTDKNYNKTEKNDNKTGKNDNKTENDDIKTEKVKINLKKKQESKDKNKRAIKNGNIEKNLEEKKTPIKKEIEKNLKKTKKEKTKEKIINNNKNDTEQKFKNTFNYLKIDTNVNDGKIDENFATTKTNDELIVNKDEKITQIKNVDDFILNKDEIIKTTKDDENMKNDENNKNVNKNDGLIGSKEEIEILNKKNEKKIKRKKNKKEVKVNKKKQKKLEFKINKYKKEKNTETNNEDTVVEHPINLNVKEKLVDDNACKKHIQCDENTMETKTEIILNENYSSIEKNSIIVKDYGNDKGAENMLNINNDQDELLKIHEMECDKKEFIDVNEATNDNKINIKKLVSIDDDEEIILNRQNVIIHNDNSAREVTLNNNYVLENEHKIDNSNTITKDEGFYNNSDHLENEKNLKLKTVEENILCTDNNLEKINKDVLINEAETIKNIDVKKDTSISNEKNFLESLKKTDVVNHNNESVINNTMHTKSIFEKFVINKNINNKTFVNEDFTFFGDKELSGDNLTKNLFELNSEKTNICNNFLNVQKKEGLFDNLKKLGNKIKNKIFDVKENSFGNSEFKISEVKKFECSFLNPIANNVTNNVTKNNDVCSFLKPINNKHKNNNECDFLTKKYKTEESSKPIKEIKKCLLPDSIFSEKIFLFKYNNEWIDMGVGSINIMNHKDKKRVLFLRDKINIVTFDFVLNYNANAKINDKNVTFYVIGKTEGVYCCRFKNAESAKNFFSLITEK
ncbi:hypothetical protein COBT_000950 [Conglomerata obtusa]